MSALSSPCGFDRETPAPSFNPSGTPSPLLKADSSLRVVFGFLMLALGLLGVSGCGGGWGEFKPTITAQVNNVTVTAGQTAAFKVTATGTGPMTYQWFKNGTSVGSTGTATTYSWVAQADDNGANVSVNVSNAGGTATSAGILTVQTPPVITTQPVNQTVAAGQTATFNVAASGTGPLSFQWFLNGSPISGATSSVYTTPATSLANNGQTYTATAQNMLGTATSVVAALSVTPSTPTLSFAPIATQTYGNPAFPVSATSASSGAVTYAIVSGPATISGSMVTPTGTGTVVVSASQAASGTYGSATATASFAMNPEVPTLTFAPVAAQTFGGAAFPVSATSASSGAVTYTVVSGPATVSGTTVTATGAGTVVLSASQAANGNYAAATASTNVTVGPETPTLAFAPIATESYGSAPFQVSATSASSGAVTYTVVSGPATLSGSTVTLTGTGVVVLSASQAANGSYGTASASTKFTVGEPAPTLTFAPIPTETYGGAPFAVSATSASSGAVTYSVTSGPATISGNMVTATGIGPVVLSATQAANGNYGAAAASTTFTVNPEVPVLTFAPIVTQTFGGAPFAVSATSASPGAITYSVVSGPATISGSSVTLTGAGAVVIGASQAASGNYAAASTSTTIGAGTEKPTLTFAPIATQTYGGAPFAVSATSASSGAVTYTVVSGPATVAGSTVTTSGTGTIVLSANQAPSGGYSAATASTSFTVGPQTPTLAFAPIAPESYGNAPFMVSATSASNGAVVYAVISGPATISGSTVTLSGNGTVLLSANQAATANYTNATATTTFTVGAQVPALAFAPIATQTFGGNPFQVSATSASSGAVTYAIVSGPATVSGSTVTITGAGTVVLGASQAANGGYATAVATTNFAVNPAVPTLTFAPIPAENYGSAPFQVSATSASSGAVTYTVASGPATVSGSTVTLTGNGAVVLNASQAASGNYAAASASATITAGAETPTLAFAPIATQTYGNPPFAVSATSASPGAVSYSVVSGPATVSGGMVTLTGDGTVVLGASQVASGSYASATASTTFTVGAETPTLVFAPIAAQTYGNLPFQVSATSASSGAVTYAVLSGPATISGSTVTLTGTGPVVLSASQAASGNYGVGTANANFTVGAETPTLAFAPIATQTYGNAPFPVSATSASPGAVTYAVVSGPAMISGSTVTLTGVGPVVLSANQAASGSYAAATASANFTIATEVPTLSFVPVATQTFGNGPFTVSASSASSGAVTYSVVTGPATINGATVTLSGNGTVILGASQAANGNYAAANATTTFSVGAQSPTLTFAPIPTETYGNTPFAVSATSVSPGTVTYTVVSGPATISGSTVTLTGVGTV